MKFGMSLYNISFREGKTLDEKNLNNLISTIKCKLNNAEMGSISLVNTILKEAIFPYDKRDKDEVANIFIQNYSSSSRRCLVEEDDYRVRTIFNIKKSDLNSLFIMVVYKMINSDNGRSKNIVIVKSDVICYTEHFKKYDAIDFTYSKLHKNYEYTVVPIVNLCEIENLRTKESTIVTSTNKEEVSTNPIMNLFQEVFNLITAKRINISDIAKATKIKKSVIAELPTNGATLKQVAAIADYLGYNINISFDEKEAILNA